MMKVIIISGHSGSGKDTFSDFLIKNLPDQKILTIHFGDPVKWIAKQFFNWDGDKTTLEGRHLLQYIGTDLMRNYDPDYWCRMIGEFLAALDSTNMYDLVLIPDARFPNEIEVIQEFFPESTTVCIERYNEDGTKYINPNLSQEQTEHSSETSLDYYAFSYIIENTGDLDSLEDSAKTLIEDLKLN